MRRVPPRYPARAAPQGVVALTASGKAGTLELPMSDPPYRALPSMMAEESEATRITNLSALEPELRTRRQQVAAYLVVLQGTNVGEMHKIDGPELVLGRAMNVQVRLNDDGISRRH